ncbi:MAG: SpoIID/LytB domain protein [Pseudonocardiales bacterium]|nr:SpoIID/LytB domain protein [Pseudonocardiales bacterium]
MGRRARRGVLVIVAATVALAGGVFVAGPATAAEVYVMPSSGSLVLAGRGNGHGHGMSQYGARGAAIQHLTARQIVQFYYPNTSLVALSNPGTIRVLVSGSGATTVVAPSPGLRVTGVGAVTTAGVTRFRLIATAGVTTLTLQRLVAGAWHTLRAGVPNGAEFSRPAGTIRLYLSDGSSTVYRGVIRSVRGGSGVLSINRASLDQYTAGVVPREMPASWEAAAVQAQAIAARSYGRNAVESSGGQPYDICDTTSCQVYGGMTRYDAAGQVLWTDYPPALSGNANTVLQYGGRTIFAQFSASDGGWTAAGGQPYLVAKADPYDNVQSGDPYLTWQRTVSVAGIASSYGLARLTKIEITGRDGHGPLGGRVVSGFVDGLDSRGVAQRIATTGFELQGAMGLPTNWFKPTMLAAPIGHVDSVRAVSANHFRVAGWALDPDHLDRSIRVHIYVDGSGYPFTANASRPDVKRIYHTVTDQLGFAVVVPVPAGSHNICVYGIDIDVVHNTLIRCVRVTA